MYPIIGGIFFNSGTVVQTILILAFFSIRTSYEYSADSLTAKHFGSDGMVVVSFMGVAMYEICLSIMITSIRHPLIFVMLVLVDVAENTYCLWSLHRLMRTGTNRVSPIDVSSSGGGGGLEKISPLKRTSSVYKAIQNFSSKTPKEQQGTALFIVATLLQREMVEIMIPIQALGIMSILYAADVKSNSITSSWDGVEDYHQTLMYTGIDIGVELVIFASTIYVLARVFPDLSVRAILSGLIRMHHKAMFTGMLTTWLSVLFFQSTYSGMDTSFRFEWLKCEKAANSTWLGGFAWDC